jgi:hypothetical protein
VKRIQALESVAKGELDRAFVPETEEQSEELQEAENNDESDEEDSKDVLDLMKERQFGTRRSE